MERQENLSTKDLLPDERTHDPDTNPAHAGHTGHTAHTGHTSDPVGNVDTLDTLDTVDSLPDGPETVTEPEAIPERDHAGTTTSGTTGTPAATGTPANTGEETNQPLFAADEVAGYRENWQAIQTAFVDDPQRAVREADELVAQVIQSLAATFAAHKSELEGQWSRGDEVATEDLRLALRQYRSFFNQLLST